MTRPGASMGIVLGLGDMVGVGLGVERRREAITTVPSLLYHYGPPRIISGSRIPSKSVPPATYIAKCPK